MRKIALVKDACREIKKSLGRFFSIMLIVALGVAFLAGIKVSSPMMGDTTDQYMDDYGMMDVRVLSTVGIEEVDIRTISQLEQVESVTGSISIDALATIGDSQKVVKVHSLDNLSPEDSGFINKPMLIEGRWPSAPNECLIDGTELTMLPVEISDFITLTTGTDESIEDVLVNDTYKVVGIMHSPYYMHFERGTAEIGNGSVASYLYIPEDNFKSDIYTELFITLKGAKALDSYSEAYTQLVDDFKIQLEPIMEERANIRYKKLVEEGKLDLEEGELQFEREKEKANKELEQAALDLEKGEKEILQNEEKLTQGQLEAEESFKQAEQALREAEIELDEKQKKYEEGVALFEREKEKVETQLQDAKEQLELGKKQLQNLKAQLKSIEAQLVTASEGNKEALLKEKVVLEEQITQITSHIQASEQAYEQGVLNLQLQEEDLMTSGTQLEQGRTALAQQKAKLATEKAATLQTLEEGRVQLEVAKKELAEGKEKYITAKADAEKQLGEAEEKLVEGREQLENLKEPKVYLLGRDTNYGFVNYKSAVQTIERIGKIFPLFFFVVAALVCLTTMTRMVDEGRTTIGTYKALGYSSFAIMSKYILYAGVASIVGSLLGSVIGFKVFPNTIYNAYGTMFTTPPLINKFYPKEAISAIVIMTALTVFAVIFTMMKSLKEQPTELMRPKAPPAGKRILLERIPFVWKRMNFFQKVVARNIFRYKKKFFMTTIGIAGCTALLVAGLGLKQSIISIVDRQYKELFQYHLEVILKEGSENTLDGKNYITDQLEVSSMNVKVGAKDEERSATLRIIKDVDKLPKFIKLRDRQSQTTLELQEGVIISEKLAHALQVQAGDTLWFENSDLERYQVKVVGITENYLGHFMYVSDAYIKEVTQEAPTYNQLLIQLEDASASQEQVISQELIEDENVVAFTFTTKNAENFESMTETLNTVVIILVVSAALLAFVVLYNLTTINISERFREIATIKVLGFNDFKVSQYIYRENMMLTLIGALVGLLLGKALFLFIIVTAEMDEMMFGREIYSSSYIIAIVLTFIFAILVNIMMHFKLQKIEMVESLKSVE